MDRKSIHIGLNAQLLSLSQDYRATGINWYIYHLLKHLPTIGGGHRFTAFTSEVKAPQLLPGIQFHLTRLPTRNPIIRIFWEQLLLPFMLPSEKIDLIHGLGFVLPLASASPGVVTVFDLGFLLYPQAHKPWRRIYLAAMARLSAQKARRIIAISESTKADILRLWKIPSEKVAVVYLGVDSSFYPGDQQDTEEFRQKRGLPQKMILTLGTIEPRKNLPLLLEAYAQLKRNGLPHTLVIAGAPGWGAKEVFAQAEKLGLEGKVLFPGYIPSEELPLWYRAADLFVYPSLYEGFGLPPLEAMACGIPTIVSRSSSLPEVVGEAALTFDPQDGESLGGEIEQVLRDPVLQAEMRAKGQGQASRFSWQRCAQETVAVYESAARN